MGKQRADQARRDGVAARCPEPAGPQRLAVDLALLDDYDHLLRDMALCVLPPATPHDAHTRCLLRTVPGIGASLRLERLYERHDIQRVPRGPDGVSSCRLGKWVKAAAVKC
jgi:hypothetical protein